MATSLGLKLKIEKMASKADEIFNCVFSGDLDHLKQLLEVAVDVSVDSPEQDLFGAVDECGRNALLAASLLGNTSIVRELVTHGARVNEQTVRGYSSLHLAACWGRMESVQTLLELGADTQAKTFRGETPVDLARKYSHTDCAECLTVAETTKEEAITESQKDLTVQEKPDWNQPVKPPSKSYLTFQKKTKKIEDIPQTILGKLLVDYKQKQDERLTEQLYNKLFIKPTESDCSNWSKSHLFIC